jgi:methionyl-tRNA synthetase
MVRRYRDGVVPDVELDPVLRADFDGLADAVSDLFDGAELTAALETIWQRVRRCNRYVEERRPWQLAKDESAAHELSVVLASLIEAVRVLSVLLSPFLPEATATLLGALGAGGDRALLDRARFATRGSSALVEELAPLCPRR